MDIKLNNKSYSYWINDTNYYSMRSINKFIDYFFPDNIPVNITDTSFNSIIYDIQMDSKLNTDVINILVSVENCNCHSHYTHYNRYGNFGNDKIHIYLYNHIDKYIAIPVIYTQINYFNRYCNSIKPTNIIPFSEKKFCIFATGGYLRAFEKNTIKQYLSQLGTCDTLELYKDTIHNKSCYHSEELMNIFQQYKFVFVCENSVSDGYITEKIFNCFFSHSIPIYSGSNAINRFINKDSFINVNNINSLHTLTDDIVSLSNDESLFMNKINTHKINKDFDDEKYSIKFKSFVDSIFNAHYK